MRRQSGGNIFKRAQKNLLSVVSNPMVDHSINKLEGKLNTMIGRKIKNKTLSRFLKQQLKTANPFVKDIIKQAVRKQSGGGRRRRHKKRRHRMT